MSEEKCPGNGFEIQTPLGKLSSKGKDGVQLGVLIAGLALIAYILWEHKVEASQMGAAVMQSYKETTIGMQRVERAINLQTCVLAKPQEKRDAEFKYYGECKQSIMGMQ